MGTRTRNDPWGESAPTDRTVSILSRREIFDYLRGASFPWYGTLDELPFLSRLYDLESLPSTDYRFKTASGDIRQHRINNHDSNDDWIFSD